MTVAASTIQDYTQRPDGIKDVALNQVLFHEGINRFSRLLDYAYYDTYAGSLVRLYNCKELGEPNQKKHGAQDVVFPKGADKAASRKINDLLEGQIMRANIFDYSFTYDDDDVVDNGINIFGALSTGKKQIIGKNLDRIICQSILGNSEVIEKRTRTDDSAKINETVDSKTFRKLICFSDDSTAWATASATHFKSSSLVNIINIFRNLDLFGPINISLTRVLRNAMSLDDFYTGESGKGGEAPFDWDVLKRNINFIEVGANASLGKWLSGFTADTSVFSAKSSATDPVYTLPCRQLNESSFDFATRRASLSTSEDLTAASLNTKLGLTGEDVFADRKAVASDVIFAWMNEGIDIGGFPEIMLDRTGQEPENFYENIDITKWGYGALVRDPKYLMVIPIKGTT